MKERKNQDKKASNNDHKRTTKIKCCDSAALNWRWRLMFEMCLLLAFVAVFISFQVMCFTQYKYVQEINPRITPALTWDFNCGSPSWNTTLDQWKTTIFMNEAIVG